jgi:ribonuclease PH
MANEEGKLMREDLRKAGELRPVEIIPGYVVYPEGSALIHFGKTTVLCNATLENGIPRWMQAQGIPGGWVTAEYGMLPRATHQRTPRESNQGGRSVEIRRLIGRSLRAAVNLRELGQRTCILDCDVLQADGGTRTAAITGAYVAMAIALRKLVRDGILPESVFKSPVAAVSVGVIDGMTLLDLNYAEDSRADVDVNVVMNGQGEFIEVQATGEAATYTRSALNDLLDLAYKGIGELLLIQKQVLEL